MKIFEGELPFSSKKRFVNACFTKRFWIYIFFKRSLTYNFENFIGLIKYILNITVWSYTETTGWMWEIRTRDVLVIHLIFTVPASFTTGFLYGKLLMYPWTS